MPVQELKGEYIKVPFLSLQRFQNNFKDIDEASKRIEINKLPLKSLSSTQFRYLLVDFYEWLNLFRKDSDFRKSVEGAEFISNNLKKYEDFIIETSYRMTNVKRVNSVLSKYLDYDYLEDIFIMYEIFMKNIEKIQLQFLDIYINNTATNPVALVPWSYGLNRLTSTINIISEEDDSINLLKIKPNLGQYSKEEGTSNIYNLRPYFIEDGITRPIIVSPIELIHYDTALDTEELLPESWKKFFDINVKRTSEKYKVRLKLVKALFSQYLFYGRHQMQSNRVFYLNYPFLLPDVDNRKINVREQLEEKLDCQFKEVFEITKY